MTIQTNPAEILQTLIRFDTTNPPGNEYLANNWAHEQLANAGIESTLLAKDPNRPNLIARIKGNGNAPPLLLQGHVDVVTTEGQSWSHPPFAGEIHDDYIWGRGALDMKGGVAMMLAAFLRAHQEKTYLPGDVILCLLADEEDGGDFGAKFLVEKHPEYFEGVRFAFGEFGGFTMEIAGETFYPIMVAEKQICWLKIVLHGPAGHGSMVHRGGAMARLGQILQTLDRNMLPAHTTPPVRQMVSMMADGVSFPTNALMKQLLNPSFSDRILSLMGEAGKAFLPLFHNTVNATIVHGGDKVNVIPSEISLELDGRLLPGYKPGQMLTELKNLLGTDLEIKVVRHDPGPAEPNMALFDTLAGILKEKNPNGHPIPLVLSGVTDARFFSQLGIQTYGFLPLTLPNDFKFTAVIHAADERIPIEALSFGTQAIFEALQRFGEANTERL
jgi:acetylornithine deacetylase/succinyl-diaminopimelate desuccinylase-like protein